MDQEIVDILRNENRSDRDALRLALKYNDLEFFTNLIEGINDPEDPIITNIWKKIKYQFFPKDSLIFREGEPSNDRMYIIIYGAVQVGKQKTGQGLRFDKLENIRKRQQELKEMEENGVVPPPKFTQQMQQDLVEIKNIEEIGIGEILAELSTGKSIGIQAIQEKGGHRNASIKALKDTHCLVIFRKDYLQIKGILQKGLEDKIIFLRQYLPNFDLVNNTQLVINMTYYWNEKIFRKGDLLSNENETGELLYILISGKVKVTKNIEIETLQYNKQNKSNKHQIDVNLTEISTHEIMGEEILPNTLKPDGQYEYRLQALTDKDLVIYFPQDIYEKILNNYYLKHKIRKEKIKNFIQNHQTNILKNDKKEKRGDLQIEHLIRGKKKFQKTYIDQLISKSMVYPNQQQQEIQQQQSHLLEPQNNQILRPGSFSNLEEVQFKQQEFKNQRHLSQNSVNLKVRSSQNLMNSASSQSFYFHNNEEENVINPSPLRRRNEGLLLTQRSSNNNNNNNLDLDRTQSCNYNNTMVLDQSQQQQSLTNLNFSPRRKPAGNQRCSLMDMSSSIGYNNYSNNLLNSGNQPQQMLTKSMSQLPQLTMVSTASSHNLDGKQQQQQQQQLQQSQSVSRQQYQQQQSCKLLAIPTSPAKNERESVKCLLRNKNSNNKSIYTPQSKQVILHKPVSFTQSPQYVNVVIEKQYEQEEAENTKNNNNYGHNSISQFNMNENLKIAEFNQTSDIIANGSQRKRVPDLQLPLVRSQESFNNLQKQSSQNEVQQQKSSHANPSRKIYHRRHQSSGTTVADSSNLTQINPNCSSSKIIESHAHLRNSSVDFSKIQRNQLQSTPDIYLNNTQIMSSQNLFQSQNSLQHQNQLGPIKGPFTTNQHFLLKDTWDLGIEDLNQKEQKIKHELFYKGFIPRNQFNRVDIQNIQKKPASQKIFEKLKHKSIKFQKHQNKKYKEVASIISQTQIQFQNLSQQQKQANQQSAVSSAYTSPKNLNNNNSSDGHGTSSLNCTLISNSNNNNNQNNSIRLSKSVSKILPASMKVPAQQVLINQDLENNKTKNLIIQSTSEHDLDKQEQKNAFQPSDKKYSSHQKKFSLDFMSLSNQTLTHADSIIQRMVAMRPSQALIYNAKTSRLHNHNQYQTKQGNNSGNPFSSIQCSQTANVNKQNFSSSLHNYNGVQNLQQQQ